MLPTSSDQLLQFANARVGRDLDGAGAVVDVASLAEREVIGPKPETAIEQM